MIHEKRTTKINTINKEMIKRAKKVIARIQDHRNPLMSEAINYGEPTKYMTKRPSEVLLGDKKPSEVLLEDEKDR